MTNQPSTDIIDSLVINHEGAVTVLKGGVGTEGGIVGLNHGSGHLRGWVDTELQLGLLPIIHGEPLHQQGGES